MKITPPEQVAKEEKSEMGFQNTVEGNDWQDTFWGFDFNLGYGKNMLGQLLMKIRAEHQSKLKK